MSMTLILTPLCSTGASARLIVILRLSLLGVVVEGRVAALDAAEALRRAGQEEHRLGERGLPGTPVAHEDDVADVRQC